MLRRSLVAVTTLAAALFVASAPSAQAAEAAVLFEVPGVISTTHLGTYFACTSTDTVNQVVTVAILDRDGAVFNSVSIGMSPKTTRLFGTQVASGLDLDVGIGAGSANGSALISSTSKKLLCSAFVADVGNATPSSLMRLTIVAKTKQKGD